MQYFNLYSVVSDKDTGLRFLDNKVFVELLFMSHFANFLLERKKKGGVGGMALRCLKRKLEIDHILRALTLHLKVEM